MWAGAIGQHDSTLFLTNNTPRCLHHLLFVNLADSSFQVECIAVQLFRFSLHLLEKMDLVEEAAVLRAAGEPGKRPGRAPGMERLLTLAAPMQRNKEGWQV